MSDAGKAEGVGFELEYRGWGPLACCHDRYSLYKGQEVELWVFEAFDEDACSGGPKDNENGSSIPAISDHSYTK